VSNAWSPGTWRADLCAQEGLPVVLGHALSMQATHGGKAKHDTSDAHKMAVLLRGGMLPQASVYAAAMRAPRDLLRRRMYLTRKRAELLTQVQHTNSQYHLAEIGNKIAYQANRDGVAERFPEPAVQKRIAVDLALLGSYDELLRDLALHLVTAAKHDRTKALYLLRTVPGIGKLRSRVLLYAIHDSGRFPRVQDVVSSCRVVTCAKESAGKRYGTSGTKSGHAYRKWACSEAAGLCLRNNPAGQTWLARVEKNHGQGNALTVLARQLARAVYDMLKRGTAFDRDQFFHDECRGAGEPDASLDCWGISLRTALSSRLQHCVVERA
jgi:transposase